MTFDAAKKQLAKVGAAHAEGPALLAMYAQTAADTNGGDAQKYFDYLCSPAGKGKGHALIADRKLAWDVLMGII